MEHAIDYTCHQQKLLESIKDAIRQDKDIIPVNGEFCFTKGTPGSSSGLIYRDKGLEQDVRQWMGSRASFDALMAKYTRYYPEIKNHQWPNHYATRFVNAKGRAALGENIFMFFPEALGLHSNHMDDYFGFEFIDMWVSIFDEIIFPCMRKVFDEESQVTLYTGLRPHLERTIYLASVFHEIGHRCGYWRVSPVKHENIHINSFHTDVLGELATDALMVSLLDDFPEILYFIFLQRVFWFGRFNFKNNPIYGRINQDNDSWIGSYLWNKYVRFDAVSQNKTGLWHLNVDALRDVFVGVVEELDVLGLEVVSAKTRQDNLVARWMKRHVSFLNYRFVIPKSLQKVFWACLDVPEQPLRKY